MHSWPKSQILTKVFFVAGTFFVFLFLKVESLYNLCVFYFVSVSQLSANVLTTSKLEGIMFTIL